MQIQTYITSIFLFVSTFVCAQAKIELAKSQLDFDTVWLGDTVKDTLYIRNVGDKPLELKNVYPSDGSGCTVFGWTQSVIAPKDSGFVLAGFKRGNPGTHIKNIYIKSNGGDLMFQIVAYFKTGALIEFDKQTIYVDTVEQASYPERTFRFTNTGDEPLIISDIKGSGRAKARYYPKGPVLPNKKDSITFVGFNAGFTGFFERTLTITGNFKNGDNKSSDGFQRITIRMTGDNKEK